MRLTASDQRRMTWFRPRLFPVVRQALLRLQRRLPGRILVRPVVELQTREHRVVEVHVDPDAANTNVPLWRPSGELMVRRFDASRFIA